MPAGRFEVRLACTATEWLDPATKRFPIDGLMPQAALRLFAARATGNATWRAAIRAGEHATFDLTSARPFAWGAQWKEAYTGKMTLEREWIERLRRTVRPVPEF